MAVRTTNPELQEVADRLDERQKAAVAAQKAAEAAYQEETDSVCTMLHRAQKERKNPEYYAMDTMAELIVRAPAPAVAQIVEQQRNVDTSSLMDFILGLCAGVCGSLLIYVVTGGAFG